jgi:hypothetical protein
MTTDDKTPIDLDLDALAPKKVQINYQGKTIPVNPLSLEQFSKLYDLVAEVDTAKNSQDEKKILELFVKIDPLIKECIPELKDDKLNQIQLMALLNLLQEISSPQDKALAELKKRGINLTQKKGGGKSDPKG